MKGLNSRFWFGRYSGQTVKSVIEHNLFYIEECKYAGLLFLDNNAFAFYKKVKARYAQAGGEE